MLDAKNERNTTRAGLSDFKRTFAFDRLSVFIGTLMPKLNPSLFEPLTRIENAARRAVVIILTAPSLSPKDNELVAKEICEMRAALKEFKTAVEAGEMAGFKDGGIRSHGG